MRSRILESIILALAILGVGAFFYFAMINVKDRDRVVFVRGLAEQEVPADHVIWPIAFKLVGDDVSSLYVATQGKMKHLQNFLVKNGIAKSDISIGTPEIVDMESEYYGNTKRNYRYTSTGVVTVSSSNVDAVRAVIAKQGDLFEQGIMVASNDYRYQTIYSFTGLNKIKPAMIEEATKNAREVAEKFAKDSQSNLGKIKTASQGQFSIEDRDGNTPYIKKVRVVTNVQFFLQD